MRGLGLLCWMVFVSGCSLAFEFDDLEGLPCDTADQCDENHICRLDNRTCIARGSVEPGRSCGVQVSGNPDDLCPVGFRCVNVNGRGLRCLEPCTPVVPVGADAATELASECGAGQYCWELPTGGGACDDGECRELGNQGCAVGSQCVELNGAGRCFLECNIFASTNECVDAVCHPIDEASANACVSPGERDINETCTNRDRCRATTERGGEMLPLICARPFNESSAAQACGIRCDPISNIGCPDGGNCARIAGTGAGGAVEVGICAGPGI